MSSEVQDLVVALMLAHLRLIIDCGGPLMPRSSMFLISLKHQRTHILACGSLARPVTAFTIIMSCTPWRRASQERAALAKDFVKAVDWQIAYLSRHHADEGACWWLYSVQVLETLALFFGPLTHLRWLKCVLRFGAWYPHCRKLDVRSSTDLVPSRF